MIGWRKLAAFLGVIALGISCVLTGSDISENVTQVVLAGIGMLGVGNYLEHKMKAKQ